MGRDVRRAALASLVAVVGLLVAGAVALAAVGGGDATKHLGVTPVIGTTSSRFTVAFTVTAPTGTSSGTIRSIEARITGPAGTSGGCVHSTSRGVTAANAGKTSTTFGPGAGAHWCLGTFTGTLEETIRPNCAAGRPCPEFIALEQLGSFSFKVVRSTGAAMSTPVLKTTPQVGTPSTTFHVALPGVIRTGPNAEVDSAVYLNAKHHGNCQAGAGEDTGDVPARLTRLDYPSGVAKWCIGTYSGSATETITPACQPGRACPRFIAVRRLGNFSFTVRATP